MIVRPQTYELTISHIDYSASGKVIMMYCKIDEDIQSAIFLAGQFMLLTATINGAVIKRSYSIATTPALLQEKWLIGFSIKLVEDGVFSTRATQVANIGDKLTMTWGLGRMIDDASNDTYLLICAGSGLSPIYSIYHDLMLQERNIRIANIFGERYYADVLADVYRDWVSEVGEWVYSQCYLSQDEHIWYTQGRVQAGIVSALEWLETSNIKVFLCGWPAMVDDVRDILTQQHWLDPSQIHFEKY